MCPLEYIVIYFVRALLSIEGIGKSLHRLVKKLKKANAGLKISIQQEFTILRSTKVNRMQNVITFSMNNLISLRPS